MAPNFQVFDRLVWLPNAPGMFSSSFAWNVVRATNPLVPRSNLVWFPRHVHTWEIVSSTVCVVCSSGEESHRHLFFECPYSKGLWTKLLGQCGVVRTPKGLDEEVAWAVSNSKSTSLSIFIFKLGLAAAIYHLWCERNGRIFKGSSKSWQFLQAEVVNGVYMCISSWRNFPNSLALWLTNRS